MNVEVLMSTTNNNQISDTYLKGKNITSNILIINQCDNNKKYCMGSKRLYNYSETGLSKSRNRAIECSKGDICIIADDDIIYKDDYEEKVKEAFIKNPDIDIISFQIETPDGGYFKEYPDTEFIHNKMSILKVSSIDIAFRRESILSSNIKFDELFGLGAKYNTGEQNVFLNECLKKGLKAKYIPVPIVVHPYENSGRIFNKQHIISKGAVFAKLFGVKIIFINFLFALKKYNEYKFEYSFLNALKLFYKGSFNYFKHKSW